MYFFRIGQVLCSLRPRLSSCLRLFFGRILPNAILVPRHLWIFSLGGVCACALLAIFHSPGLSLPDSSDLRLFPADHPFERYEWEFRRRFGFERRQARDVSLRMPLRFVWGVRPQDDGNSLDPGDKGKLVYDQDFDISTPDAQRWMLRFCEDVRKQVLNIRLHYVMLFASLCLKMHLIFHLAILRSHCGSCFVKLLHADLQRVDG